MKKNNSFKNILIVFGLIILVAVAYQFYNKIQPGQLDTFAQCLSDKGAKFYGAFWCPHCQAQKALFGNSKNKLPYIECSTPDGNGQVDICKQKGITAYPSWSFPIASTTSTSTEETISGERTLKELSEKTGCALPEGY